MVKSGCLNDKNSPIAEAQTNSNSQKIQPLFIHQWIQRLRVPSQTAFTVSLSGFSWISALVDRCSKEIHEYHATSRPKPSQNMCFHHSFTLRLSPKQQSSPKDPVKREDSALDRMDMGPEGLVPEVPKSEDFTVKPVYHNAQHSPGTTPQGRTIRIIRRFVKPGFLCNSRSRSVQLKQRWDPKHDPNQLPSVQ